MLQGDADTDGRVQGETPGPPGAERYLLVVMQPRAERGFYYVAPMLADSSQRRNEMRKLIVGVVPLLGPSTKEQGVVND
jgi:hypothetical protein